MGRPQTEMIIIIFIEYLLHGSIFNLPADRGSLFQTQQGDRPSLGRSGDTEIPVVSPPAFYLLRATSFLNLSFSISKIEWCVPIVFQDSGMDPLVRSGRLHGDSSQHTHSAFWGVAWEGTVSRPQGAFPPGSLPPQDLAMSPGAALCLPHPLSSWSSPAPSLGPRPLPSLWALPQVASPPSGGVNDRRKP